MANLLVVLTKTWLLFILFEPHLINLVHRWDVLWHLLILQHLFDSFPLFKLSLAFMGFIWVSLGGSKGTLLAMLLASLSKHFLIIGQQSVDVIPLIL